jgi:hypothetical protein
MKPEDVVRKLATKDFRKGMWVAIRNGVDEPGVSTLVDALKYVGCKVEVDTDNRRSAPTWFTKPDRWTVSWVTPHGAFNINALRKGQDMLVCSGSEQLTDILKVLSSYDTVNLGVVVDDSELGSEALELIWSLQASVYPKLEDRYA